ncbi:hypothetical protein D3C81_1730310 [compost metagenome]
MGRYAQGVKLINIREDDAVATLCRADKEEEDLSEHEDGEEGQGTIVEEVEPLTDSEPEADVEGEEDSLE